MRLHEIRPNTFAWCRSKHPRGLKIQIDSSGQLRTGEGQNRPFARYHNLPHELVTGTPESTPSQTRYTHARPESSPVCQGPDKVRLHEIRPNTFAWCRSKHPRGLKIQIDSSGQLRTGEGQNRPFARYHNLPHELVTGTPESTPSQTGCMHGELLPW